MAVPAAPTNLTAEQSDGNILLSWTASSGATGYEVQRSTDGVNFSNYAAVGIVNQYIDSLPGIGIMYYYQVAGIYNTGIAYLFTVSSANATAGATYTNNGVTFTVLNTIAASTVLFATAPAGTGPLASGTLTKASGTGDATVTFSAFSTFFSNIAQMVAAPPSEMSLFELRLRAQETADRVNSQFVIQPEWNSFLRLAMYELYDLLITVYEDLFAQNFVFINTNGTTQNYPVPDGVTNYLGGVFGGVSGIPALAFYKLAGMDLGINTSNNAWVTLLKFDFIERNRYVYPNSTSTIYGVYNMRYRLMGNNVNIIPTPAGNQQIRMWYSPKLPGLLKDTDLTTLGYSGWLRYPIVRAAKYALDKEEGTDTSKLDAEIAFLKSRIEQSASNRDVSMPDTISATRQDPVYGGNGFGGGGNNAGW